MAFLDVGQGDAILITLLDGRQIVVDGGPLATDNPQIVVVSVGEDNRFGHPSPEVLERYAVYGLPILRTDQRGTIEFVTDGRRLWLEMAR